MLGCALLSLGCPKEVDPERAAAPPPKSRPQVDESDPRVVKVGDDLYAADALPQDEPSDKKKGSGKPDESNGYCRLYAPKSPDPQCCQTEYGFDAEFAGEACGTTLYMGESFQHSCGYYFHEATQGQPLWLRASFIDAQSPKAAADAEVNRIKIRFGDTASAEPIPGTPEAYRVVYKGIGYAYFGGNPGWPNTRRLAWKEGLCSDEGIAKIVGHMAAAKPPPKGAPRPGLIPRARQ